MTPQHPDLQNLLQRHIKTSLAWKWAAITCTGHGHCLRHRLRHRSGVLAGSREAGNKRNLGPGCGPRSSPEPQEARGQGPTPQPNAAPALPQTSPSGSQTESPSSSRPNQASLDPKCHRAPGRLGLTLRCRHTSCSEVRAADATDTAFPRAPRGTGVASPGAQGRLTAASPAPAHSSPLQREDHVQEEGPQPSTTQAL